jgi:hypothetical protein
LVVGLSIFTTESAKGTKEAPRLVFPFCLVIFVGLVVKIALPPAILRAAVDRFVPTALQ